MEDSDEGELVEAARAGDPRAWERLYRRAYPRLRAYLAYRIGYKDVDEAVSETMTRAIAGIESFALGDAGFDGWLFGIAYRVAADHHRRSARWRRFVTMGGKDRVDDVAHEAMMLGEEHDRVRRALAELPHGDRELLELRVVAGLTTEQVAVALHKSTGAVRTAQSRALARLRKILEASGDD